MSETRSIRNITGIETESLKSSLFQLCVEAGQKILDYYHSSDSPDIINKSDNSPLTQADLASHEILVAGLTRVAPELPVLSEETEDADWETRKKWQSYWLVDPLDGTKEFVLGIPEFSVSIALVEENQPILAIIYNPANRELYHAVRKQGAFLKDRKSTRLNSSHSQQSRMPSSA